MTRAVGLAGAAYLSLYIVASFVTGQWAVWLGAAASLVSPAVFAIVAIALARRCRGQVRAFWNLNATHGVLWAAGQVMPTRFDVTIRSVPVVSAAHLILVAATIPLATALYGRPDRNRPLWISRFVLVDFILVALFATFAYIYFMIGYSGASANPAPVNLAPLVAAIDLAIAAWATVVWFTSKASEWRQVLGLYAFGLATAFGVVLAISRGGDSNGRTPWDLMWVMPYAVMAIAALHAYDRKLFTPAEEAPEMTNLPAMSLVTITLLAAIPLVDEAARRMLAATPAIASFRTRLTLVTLVPFGGAILVREVLARRALRRAGQQVAAMREQLARKEKLAAVGQLLSGVAHELNNPLQGVVGYAELLLAGKNTATESEELRAILDNARRAAGTVRNLLAFAGRASSARGWQQMNRIVRDAVATREPHLQAARIGLRMDLADRLPLVYVDEGRLKDTLVRLIQHAEAAVTSRPEDETPGSLARIPGEVVVSTKWQTGPDRIVVEVADNGRGLTAEELARIFDPFRATQSPEQGSGRSLSTCYGTVREHGGEITASNGEVVGAVFTIELPVMAQSRASEAIAGARAAHVPPTAETRPTAPFAVMPIPEDDLDKTPRRRTALVVDDEESNAALVRRVLAQAGYDVESTTLSRRALVMIERAAYDAVICDVKMPELGGRDLYGRVCQIRPEMSRRFIFITGDIDGQETRQFLDQSGCSYFMKPFNLERLTAAVDMITGSRPPDTIG